MRAHQRGTRIDREPEAIADLIFHHSYLLDDRMS